MGSVGTTHDINSYAHVQWARMAQAQTSILYDLELVNAKRREGKGSVVVDAPKIQSG